MSRTMKIQVYLAILCCAHVRCDLFTSVEDLQLAVRAVEELQWKIGKHIRTQMEKLDSLLEITTGLEAYIRPYLEDPRHRLSHPIHAFLFTKKAVLEWDKLTNVEYGTWLLKYKLPVYEDLQGTVAAIRRLQDTYNLQPADIAAGDLYGLKSPNLSASDCFTIGYLTYKAAEYRAAHEWMTVAYDTLTREKTPTLDIDEVSEYLELSEMEAEEEEWDEDEDEDEEDMECENKIEEKLILSRYKALCRGEDLMAPKKQRELVCRYVSGEPHVALNRVKLEELYRDPWVVQYHDVISNQHIHQLKHIAQPQLERSQTRGGIVDYRISKSATLSEMYKPVRSLETKIQAITGMSIETAEPLQVTNYGVGGFYTVHTDHDHATADGNRIATFMAYLSDVEAGGATVFPVIGVKMFPKKGSAIFWYNLFPSGDGDENTRHAACPVVSGSKWVATKWIRERGNEFTRPCTLNSEE